MEDSEQKGERADLTGFTVAVKVATSAVTPEWTTRSIKPADCIETTYELDCYSVFP
jgi:hypothetical protein